MNPIEALPTRLFVITGLAFCLIALALVFVSPGAALTGWLAALLFTSSLPLGSLCLVMMMRIIPGRWRESLSAGTEASILLLPLLVVLTLPLLIGLPWIYEWANGAQLDGMKSVYLTPFFFALRTVLILAGACWLGLELIRRPGTNLALAAGGLIVFVILHGVLSVDWVMSLDAHFHSSGFGLYILSGQVLAALAMLILVQSAIAPMKHPAIFGGLLLTAILLWVYLAFMQYFIIWSGNLTQGVVWYKRRGEGLWADIEYLITLLHLLPLFLLLFAPVRKGRRWLAALSAMVLFGRLLDYAWLTMPSLTSRLDVSVTAYGLSVAGIALLAFAALSRSTSLLARLRPAQKLERA